MRTYRSKAEWAVILEEYATTGKCLEALSQERYVSDSSIYRRLRKRSEREGEFIELVQRQWLSLTRLCAPAR